MDLRGLQVSWNAGSLLPGLIRGVDYGDFNAEGTEVTENRGESS